jgi:cytochrome c nitrite reductase small subunit
MNVSWFHENMKRIFVTGALLAGGFVFLFFGPPALLEKTSTPDFCGVCHVMEEHYDAWFLTGVHRGIRCVDCHLPNDNTLRHLVWKSIDGMKDVIFFHTNTFSEPIRLSSHGKTVVQENCVRCHQEMVSNIKTGGLNCWDCHRKIRHTYPDISLMK